MVANSEEYISRMYLPHVITESGETVEKHDGGFINACSSFVVQVLVGLSL